MPGIILALWLAWMIYLFIYIWKLPSCQKLTIKGYKDNNWGNGNSNDAIGLKTELLKLSNPKNFMNPYSDKVVKAMDFSRELKATDVNDISKLSAIRVMMSSQLGIDIDTLAFSTHLFTIFSPIKYNKNLNVASGMNMICSDIAKCGKDVRAIESVVSAALKKIEYINSQLPSHKLDITLIFSFWALIGIIGFFIIFI